MRDDLIKIYAQIPTVPCKGLCRDSCGPIGLFPVEVDQIKPLELPTIDQNLTCSKLTALGCSIYGDRPAICRLFGVVKEMACPFGCVPERWLSKQESSSILRQIQALKPGTSYTSKLR